VLSYAYWQQRFGLDSRIVGQNISLDARPYTVIGVLRMTHFPTVSLLEPNCAVRML